MWITVDQLAHLVRQTSRRYRLIYLVDNPQVLAELIRRDYPRLEGVYDPPAIAELRERWIPSSWINHPAIPIPADLPQMDIQSPEGVLQSRERSGLANQWTPGPPNPRDEVLNDLDILRNSPVAAFGYLTMLYNGCDSEEAMKWARLDGLVFSALQMTPAGMVATSRAISRQTGQPRDIGRTRETIEADRRQLEILTENFRSAAPRVVRADVAQRVPGPTCDNVVSPLVTREDSVFPPLRVPEAYNVPPPLSPREFRAGLENGHPGGGAYPNPGNLGPR